MKNTKRILSIAVSSIMTLSSLTVFADNGDIFNKNDKSQKYTTGDAATLDSTIGEKLVLKSSDYLYELDGKFYKIGDMIDAYGKAPNQETFLTYLKSNYTDAGTVSQELKVESVSTINKTKLQVVLGQQVDAVTAENFTIEGAKVESATLSADKKTVVLNVSGVKYSTDYILTAKNIKVNGETKDFGTKTFNIGAVTDLYDLKIVTKVEQVVANGADNTLVEFQLTDKITNTIDTSADDIVLEINTTFGNLANSRVTVQDGVGKVLLTSEFSSKEVIAKITAQIIEASDDYKDLIGKVAAQTTLKFVESGAVSVDGIQLLNAESNQADRVTLYLDKPVDVSAFVKTNANGTYQTTSVVGGEDRQVLKDDVSIGIKQGNDSKMIIGFHKVAGNPKAIEIILAKSTPLTDNAKVDVTTKLGSSSVDKSFILTDAREPEVTSVTPENLKTLKLKFSESIAQGTFKIDGLWSEGKEFDLSYGKFIASTGEDFRDTATITLRTYAVGTEGHTADNNGKQRYFEAGNHSILTTQLSDFAGLTDPANVSSSQKLDFKIIADDTIPAATVTVESPEQFRVKFNKDVVASGALNTIFQDALRVKDSAGKDLVAGDSIYDGIKSNITVQAVGENEFVVELKEDWTKILPAKDSYTNYRVSFKLKAKDFTASTNGKANVESDLSLNYSGSPLNTIDNTSPAISTIASEGSQSFVVTMNEPVKLQKVSTPNDASLSEDNAGATLSVTQSGLPKVLVEFQGKDKDGKDVIIPGRVAGYADINRADKQFLAEASIDLQAGVDAGTYKSGWTVVVKSISDDIGNTAETLTKAFEIQPAISSMVYQIVSPQNNRAEGVVAYNYELGSLNKDRIEIEFTKGVVNTGGDSDLTNTSNWTLNGKKWENVASVVVEDTNNSTKDGYEKVIITFNDSNVLKSESNVVTVNRNIVSKDETELTGAYEVVAKTVNIQKAVVDVINLNSALPAAGTVSEADRDEIKAARAAYDALTPAQRALVTNTAKLTEAEAALEALVTPEQTATTAVEKAEVSKVQADVDSAQALVTALDAGTVKTALQGRIDAVQTSIKVAAATTAVEKAEASKVQADVDSAQALVTALEDGTVKTALQVRLDAVQDELTPQAKPVLDAGYTVNAAMGLFTGKISGVANLETLKIKIISNTLGNSKKDTVKADGTFTIFGFDGDLLGNHSYQILDSNDVVLVEGKL